MAARDEEKGVQCWERSDCNSKEHVDYHPFEEVGPVVYMKWFQLRNRW